MSAKIPSLDLNSNTSELYIADWCSGCKSALQKLQEAGLEFEVYDLSEIGNPAAFRVWKHRLGHNPNTVPQFWYKGQYIGNSAGITNFLKEQNVN